MRLLAIFAIMAMFVAGPLSEAATCSHAKIDESLASSSDADRHEHMNHGTKKMAAARTDGDHHHETSHADMQHSDCAEGCDGGFGCNGCVVFSALNMRSMKVQTPTPMVMLYALAHDIGVAPILFADPPPPRI